MPPFDPKNPKCPLCKQFAQIKIEDAATMQPVSCARCGDYRLHSTHPAWFDHAPRPLLSGMTRSTFDRGKVEDVTIETEPMLLSLAPKRPHAQLQRFLENVAARSNNVMGATVNLMPHDYPLAFAASPGEMIFLVNALGRQNKLLNISNTLYEASSFIISMEGWEDLDVLKTTNAGGRRAFVAMWFDPRMNEAVAGGFRPGIEEAGYEFVRIDERHFNDQIDDEIIAQIRQSRFVVADFTGNRGGVYYEAGFAKGLGLDVIWTCRDDHLEAVHFDTKQFNHITWRDPEELRFKLKNRIIATIGQGPVNHEPFGPA